MRVYFTTAKGEQLFITEVNGNPVKFHAINPPAILAALKEDAEGIDPIARVLAKGTLDLIDLIGINVIEG